MRACAAITSASAPRCRGRAREGVPWPTAAHACRHARRRRLAPEAGGGTDPADQQEELDLDALPPELAAELRALGGGEPAARPPEILEEFSNFTPDPPGHRAGFVTIIGRPNAGKSTLLNALLRQPLSIVTPRAQTTRHRVLGILSEPSFQAVFLDTPGIIANKRNMLEEKMMAAVQQAVKDADCLLAIVDASHQPEQALAMIQPGPDWKGPPMAVLLNKTDLLPGEELAALEGWFRQYCNADAVLPISALEATNLKAVTDWLVSKLPEGPSMYPKDIVSEQPERFFVAEIIRKHVFLQYRQEVPYGVAVEVTTYRERSKGRDLVEAEVVLEQDKQKSIIIGRGGTALKQLGTAARAEIEEFLGRPVYLSLSVKVRKGWRKDKQQLERLGY